MVRLKNRYLLLNFLYPSAPTDSLKDPLPDLVHFHQPSSDSLSPQVLLRIIRESVLEQYGEYGAGAISSSLKVMYLSSATSTAIVRAPRSYYRLVWGALTYITKLPKPIDQRCVIRVVRVSGTIRKAEDEAIRRAREMIKRAQEAASFVGSGAVTRLTDTSDHTGEKHTHIGGVEDEDMSDEEEDEDMGEDVER